MNYSILTLSHRPTLCTPSLTFRYPNLTLRRPKLRLHYPSVPPINLRRMALVLALTLIAVTVAIVTLAAGHMDLLSHMPIFQGATSIAGVTAMGSNIAYCASKAAVDNLTKSLARALAPKIRVVSVSPGVVDTDFIKGRDESWRDEQASRTPLGRLGTPDDVAGAAVYLASPAARFLTGQTIMVGGGAVM